MKHKKIKILKKEEKDRILESLKRCPKGTAKYAINYKETGDLKSAFKVIIGIIDRFLENEHKGKLNKSGGENLRLSEDLGIDSLTMVEIVMLVEESLNVSVENEELRNLRTLKEVKNYIKMKISGEKVLKKDLIKRYSVMDINDVVPHGQPFLFLQEAYTEDKWKSVKGIYEISGKEYFLEGHFKNNPIFPASIMLESLGQLAVFFILKNNRKDLFKYPRDKRKIYFVSCKKIRVQRMCRPGDTFQLVTSITKVRYPLAFFDGSIHVNGERTASIKDLTLIFDYKKNIKINKK
jgi:acyl carrier protein